MNKIQISIPIEKKVVSELSDEEKAWMQLAIDSAKQAYAPYSHFYVGAVVVFEDGTYMMSNNQENAAYPSGLCAERIGVFYAGATHPNKKIRVLALVAIKDGIIQNPISPCGACRQVLLESEKKQKYPIQLMLCGKNDIYMIDAAESLLPLSFSSDDL